MVLTDSLDTRLNPSSFLSPPFIRHVLFSIRDIPYYYKLRLSRYSPQRLISISFLLLRRKEEIQTNNRGRIKEEDLKKNKKTRFIKNLSIKIRKKKCGNFKVSKQCHGERAATALLYQTGCC
jgi:hypothetical protein